MAPSTPFIRKATTADIPAIQLIVHQTWPATYGPIIGEEQVTYMLDLIYAKTALVEQFEQGHDFYILQLLEKAVGFIDVQKLDVSTSKLHKIYLLQASQGNGWGRLLLQQAKNVARKNGSTTLLLNVNRFNKALDFYNKMGFEVKEEVDIPIGQGYFMNDYVMQSAL